MASRMYVLRWAILWSLLFPLCFTVGIPASKAANATTPTPQQESRATQQQESSDASEGKKIPAAVPSPASPVYGDTMVMGMLAEPSNLLPFLISDSSSRAVAGNFFIAPLKYDKDLTIIPWAAETFDILDEGLRLRFTLRKGILWEDGTELTADDVEFTYKLMIDPATPTAYAGDFKAVQEFRKLDRYSFEVVYEKPFPRSLNTWMSSIMPRHVLEGQDFRSTPLARKPLGCGPYTFREWKAGSQVIVDANPNYFEGKPYIDSIIYRIIPDATTMFLELKGKKLDVMTGLTPLQYLHQATGKEFTDEYSIQRSLGNAYIFMGYNLKSPLFSDGRVRRAFAHAINKQDIIKGALLGQGEPTIGPYKPGSWSYNDTITEYEFSPEKALALLAEAGWVRDADGCLKKNGTPFEFTLLTSQGNDQRIKTAVLLQHQLGKIGVTVKIRTVEWAAFLKQFVLPGYFDAVILGWTIPLDPDGFDVWHSSGAGKGLNFTFFGNDKADAALEAGRTTFDEAKRKAAYDTLQEVLHYEQPYSFLYVPYDLSAVQKRFQGLEPAPAGIFHNTNQWWVPLDDQRYRIQP